MKIITQEVYFAPMSDSEYPQEYHFTANVEVYLGFDQEDSFLLGHIFPCDNFPVIERVWNEKDDL